MKTEPITQEEFEEIRQEGAGRGGSIAPETALAMGLAVGEGIRFKNHVHEQAAGRAGGCKFANRIQQGCKVKGVKISVKHNGPHLLALRIR